MRQTDGILPANQIWRASSTNMKLISTARHSGWKGSCFHFFFRMMEEAGRLDVVLWTSNIISPQRLAGQTDDRSFGILRSFAVCPSKDIHSAFASKNGLHWGRAGAGQVVNRASLVTDWVPKLTVRSTQVAAAGRITAAKAIGNARCCWSTGIFPPPPYERYVGQKVFSFYSRLEIEKTNRRAKQQSGWNGQVLASAAGPSARYIPDAGQVRRE